MEEFKFLKPQIMKHPTNGMKLEYLNKSSAIACLLVSHDETCGYFVEQFRPGLNDNCIEVIAGLIDGDEKPIDALYREVAEEGGYYMSDYDIIFEETKPLAISPGYTTEKLSLYILKLKKDATQKPLHLDPGEDLVGSWINLKDVLNMTNDFKTFYMLKTFELLKMKGL